ncbi:MAG: RluA family pseudouridine synthase [Saprospiraceae bacterium]|nr:RluA family pseudouridine synthase [Saprospiraceae bacterium]
MDKDQNIEELSEIRVDPRQSPIRLDKFLCDRIEKVSRNKIQQAIDDADILVNGVQVKSNYKVRPRDIITYSRHSKGEEEFVVIPQKVDFGIVYEDDEVLVVNKPAGLVVHPGIGHPSGTLVNGLSYYLGKSEELPVKSGNTAERMGLVHRIDKNTTGLLVVAKTDHAMTHLARQFFEHTVEREYIALVWGSLEPGDGEIEGYLARHPVHRKKRKVFQKEEEGKWSKTHYETIEDLYYVSLIRCRLETGRTHQIRVHMAHKGHPLFGDDLYGGDRIMKGTLFSKYKKFVENCMEIMGRHALHARTLGFIHPKTGEKMNFNQELPEDFQQLLQRWRTYVSSRNNNEYQ